MSNKGKDWGAWTTYTGGKYKQFLGDARKALKQFKNANINVKSLKEAEGPQPDMGTGSSSGIFRLPYQNFFNSVKETVSIFQLPGMNK